MLTWIYLLKIYLDRNDMCLLHINTNRLCNRHINIIIDTISMIYYHLYCTVSPSRVSRAWAGLNGTRLMLNIAPLTVVTDCEQELRGVSIQSVRVGSEQPSQLLCREDRARHLGENENWRVENGEDGRENNSDETEQQYQKTRSAFMRLLIRMLMWIWRALSRDNDQPIGVFQSGL